MTDPIETTVDRLRAELGGPGPARASVLTEVRDGLEDAAAAYAVAGMTDREARRRAVTDFGDPALVARRYRDTAVGRISRQTAVLLGAGPVLVLTAWLVLGVAQGGLLVDGVDSGFGLITLAAVGTAGGGWWGIRQALRRNQPAGRAARIPALAMVAVCGVTWVLSYVGEPWTSPAEMWTTGWQWVHAVEAFSMVMTAAMMAAALRCLVALRHG